jgi:hypothetical protein
MTYTVVATGLTDADPFTGRVPEPTDGEMLTLVALVLVHVRVEAAPPAIVDGAAVSVTVGGGGGAVTVTVALAVAVPPSPVAVMV